MSGKTQGAEARGRKPALVCAFVPTASGDAKDLSGCEGIDAAKEGQVRANDPEMQGVGPMRRQNTRYRKGCFFRSTNSESIDAWV